MNNSSASRHKMLSFLTKPWKFGLLIALLLALSNLISWASNCCSSNSYWTNTIAFLFVFVLFNVLLSLKAKHDPSYWWQSILTYVVLIGFGSVMAYIISGLGIDEAGSYRWIILVVTMGYVILIGMIRTIQYLVGIAEDPNHKINNKR